ncbi:MAG: hypothetical protein ACK4MT_08620, partial [Thermaurantiacus tibetensis]
EFREIGEAGDRELGRVKDGADRASRALDMLDAATRGIAFLAVAAGVRALGVDWGYHEAAELRAAGAAAVARDAAELLALLDG